VHHAQSPPPVIHKSDNFVDATLINFSFYDSASMLPTVARMLVKFQ